MFNKKTTKKMIKFKYLNFYTNILISLIALILLSDVQADSNQQDSYLSALQDSQKNNNGVCVFF